MRSCLTQESVDTPRRPGPHRHRGRRTTPGVRRDTGSRGRPTAAETGPTTRARHTRARGDQGHAPAPEVLSRVPDPVPLGAARFPPARRGSARPLRPLALTPVAGGRARALPLQEYVHAGQPRRHTTCVQMGETETQPKGFAATMHPGRRRRARFPARGGRVARARSLRRARGRASRAVCSRCTSLVDSSPRHSHDSALAWRAACAHCRHARAQAGLKRDRVSFCAFTHAASPPF